MPGPDHALLELIAVLESADELDAVADELGRLLLRREGEAEVDVVDGDQGGGAGGLVDGVEAAVGGERRIEPAVRLAEGQTAGVADGVAGGADGRVHAGGRIQPPEGVAGPVDAVDHVAFAGEVVDVARLSVGRADERRRPGGRVDLERLRGARVALVDPDQPPGAVERQAALEDEADSERADRRWPRRSSRRSCRAVPRQVRLMPYSTPPASKAMAPMANSTGPWGPIRLAAPVVLSIRKRLAPSVP